MCTVTWLHEDFGYHLFSSRDERHTRAPAIPPRVFTAGGARWTMPLDADGGGSWISVNKFGLSLCLLNGASSHGRVSRGRLVADLAPCLFRDDIARALQHTALDRYAPFLLAALEPGAPAMLIEWDGRDLAVFPNAERFLPLASSSLDAAGARSARARLFEAMRPASPAALIRFHSSHNPEPGPLSPCMHRGDAATVSFTHVHVGAESVRMTYYDAPLCRNPQPFTVHLHAPHSLDCSIHAHQ